jgi:RNA-directed DNA polymerase
MATEIEKNVPATPLVILSPEQVAQRKEDQAKRAEERARRAKERDEHAARWKAIQEAGGKEAWIAAELRARGLVVDQEGGAVQDADKNAYKERKKAEAKEKRALEKLAWQAYRATHVAFVGAGIYYRDVDDEMPADKDARVARAKEHDLLALGTPDDLAKALGVTMPILRWMCFHRDVDPSTHYHYWTIPKRDGSRRTITAPKSELKAVQRWLLRNVFEKLPVHHAAHGFLAARSIETNARVHAGADVVVKVDVKDFFPTITFRRVKGLVRRAGIPENVATLIALLVTESPREIVQFRGKTLYVAKGPRALPQGAPTSPAITNAMCLRMDKRLSGLARTMGFAYTRYADDLAFSYSKKRGQKGSRTPAPIGQLLHGARQILEAEGFHVNAKKTTVMRGGNTQRITGLVVNDAPGRPPARVPREVVRRLRAAIHNREKGKAREGESLAQIKGLAAFVHMADEKRGREFLDRIAALERAAT